MPADTDILLRPWVEAVLADFPGLEIVDAHTHIGANDPDGVTCSEPELLADLDRVAARAATFAMHEPDGYAQANDAVLAAAQRSRGRLTAFCRVDPARGAVAEARRCLDAGARGIKLHPRADAFTLDHPEVERLVALAAERRVPVLVHAGRGIPALGRHALDLCARHPDAPLILAHAAISDLSWIWRHAAEHPNLFFDTAWWNPVELLLLFELVPPGQILLASDIPYGTAQLATIITLRCAVQAGLNAEQIRSVAGEQATRLLAGEPARDAGPAPGAPATGFDPILERVAALLLVAIGPMFGGELPEETLALTRLACEVGESAPQAPVCRSVLALLDLLDEHRDDLPRRGPLWLAAHIVVTAAVVARAPDAPLPEAAASGERVGERSGE